MKTYVLRLVLNDLSTETVKAIKQALVEQTYCIAVVPGFQKIRQVEIDLLDAQIKKIDQFLATKS